MAVGEAVALVDLALEATAAYQRPDLDQRLHQTRARLAEPDVRVLVVGEFKQGKSQLVNALLGAEVCPVDDDVATAVPTVVRHAEALTATLVHSSGARREVELGRLAEHVSEAGNPGNADRLHHAEIGAPWKLLARGLVLVDTPGVGGLDSPHGAITMSALPTADAVLLVSDAAQSYTRPELDFLDAAMRLCPNVACVLTKTDLYREWREAAAADRAALAAAGIEAELIPVSSILRMHAVRTDDAELDDESGFPALFRFLHNQVVAQADLLARRSTRQDVLAVAEQLGASMRTELTAQRDPARAQELIAELEEAKASAAELKERSARWQVTLNDGVTDLTADVDHDLRDRLRHVMREAEDTIDGADPAKIWEQFSAWVNQQVGAAAAASWVRAGEQARELARQVDEHFAVGGEAVLPDLPIGSFEDGRGRAAPLEEPEVERYGIGQRAFAGVRGGYMGALMVGMVSTALGAATLLNPFAIGAGVLMGGKSIRDERKRRLEKARLDARGAVRKHVDDVTFQVGKDCRDMLRELQRTLRDHFTAQAEQLQNSIGQSLQAAQQAVKTDETSRARRIRDLEAELARIDILTQRAQAL